MSRRVAAGASPRVVPLLFLLVYFAVPVCGAFVRFARPDAFIDAVTDPSLRAVAWFTFWQAGVSTLLTFLVGMPLAWALSCRSVPGAGIIRGVVTAPFLMPAVVVATGVSAVVPSRGIPAILFAHVVFNIAVVVRVVVPRWSMLGRNLEDAASDLGAGPWSTFARITWPLVSSSVVAAASLVFVFCWSSYAVIAILGGPTLRTLETEVFTSAVRIGDMGGAVAITIVQTTITAVALVLASRFSRAEEPIPSTLAQRPRHSRTSTFVAWVVTAIVASPLLAVAVRSVRHGAGWSFAGWEALFDGSLDRVGVDVPTVFLTSLRFAVTAASIALVLALLAVGRDRESFVERATFVPLVVSAVTLGLGIVLTFDTAPFDWRSRNWLIPVIHAVIAVPLVVRVIGPALRSIDTSLFDAASDLGAGVFRTRASVVLPLIRGAIMRAIGIAAAVSVGEFGATSFLTRSGSMTIPIAIAQLMGRPGPLLQQAAFALATLTAVACGALLARV